MVTNAEQSVSQGIRCEAFDSFDSFLDYCSIIVEFKCF